MSEHYVDPDFEGIGYGYALNSNKQMDAHTQGCIALWCAVIEDAFRQSTAELQTWVMTQDFSAVCEMAGVQPSAIRVAAARLARGDLLLRRGHNPNGPNKNR